MRKRQAGNTVDINELLEQEGLLPTEFELNNDPDADASDQSSLRAYWTVHSLDNRAERHPLHTSMLVQQDGIVYGYAPDEKGKRQHVSTTSTLGTYFIRNKIS